jgi:hypothetical protein
MMTDKERWCRLLDQAKEEIVQAANLAHQHSSNDIVFHRIRSRVALAQAYLADAQHGIGVLLPHGLPNLLDRQGAD